MTKGELVGSMAEKACITKAVAEKALNTFLETVTSTLKKGEKVSLVGFGTFDVTKRKARRGRNPKTGAELSIPSVRVPKFRAGRALKDAVR